MSRKTSRPAKPKRGIPAIAVTKEMAATSQLETAIKLWFTEGDPISIHALAAAANDCLHYMGRNVGKPSLMQAFIESQSRAVQDRARYFQNFIKHGWKDLKGEAYCFSRLGGLLLFDSVVCYEEIFHKKTPLMGLFFMRYVFENPRIAAPAGRRLFEAAEIDHLLNRGRREFFEEFAESLPLLGGDW